ncbi:MAG: PAS domain-containing protein [Ramlibacter sp.]
MTPGARPFDDAGALARMIAEASDDVIFAKDLEGRYQFANPATLASLGRGLAEVLGRRDAEILADAAAAGRLADHDRMVLTSGQVLEAEEPIALPDGTVRHFLTRKMPLRDAGGAVVGLLGIARDITARKQAEAHRDATHLKLQMGIQAAGLVLAEIDYRTNQNRISAELARLMALGDAEMVVPRQAIFDRIHPDDRERYLRGIAAAIDPQGDGHLAINVRAQLPDGNVRWLHIRLQVTFAMIDGRLQPDRGICAARDVSTEMIAEGKLRAARRFTESVIEGAGALVYAKDLDGRYILSNQAWRTLHGLAPEQALGATDDDIFGPGGAQLLRENDRTVARTGEPLHTQEKVMVRGRQVTLRSSKFPLYDDAGQIHAVCGVCTDITDVVEADRRKDEFIATLAHELRNPLAPIRTGLEILRRVGELPPSAARTRDMMERQLRHMVRLVDDLLDVSRVSRGKLELRLEPLTLRQVVEHALEASQPSLEAAGHALALDLPAQPVPLRGDLTRLAQVVGNLVNNATKYTPPGGAIQLAGRVEDGYAVLAVRDNGAGIAPAMLANVFDLFVQAEGTTLTGQGGLGIGLWLVRKLVEMHDGTIRADSPGLGQGSTFTVRLPLAGCG